MMKVKVTIQIVLMFLIVMSGCFLAADTASAEQMDAKAIINNMIDVFEPETSMIRDVTIKSKTGSEITAEWKAREARKLFPDGKRSLLVMLEPESQKGFTMLILERKDKTNAQWFYSPFLKRVQKIYPIRVNESFLNTDFMYGDLGFLDWTGKHELIKDVKGPDGPDGISGKEAYIIETIPDDQTYFSHFITWVSKENNLPIQRNYYDRANRLWRKERFKDVTIVNDQPTPIRIVMEDVQNNTSTEWSITKLKTGIMLQNEIFDPSHLSKIIDSELCKIYLSDECKIK